MNPNKLQPQPSDVPNDCPSALTSIRAEITSDACRSLIDVCRSALPREACGVLSCANEDANWQETGIMRIDSVYPIRNIAAQSGHAFIFDPQDWIGTLFGIRKNRQSLVGFYHSHPGTHPVPSRLDHEGLQYAEAPSYWIVSFAEPGIPAVQPYGWDGASFIPLMFAQVSV